MSISDPARGDRENPVRTLFIAVVTATVAGLILSGTSLLLRPIQAANQDVDTQRDVLELAAIDPGEDIRRTFVRRVNVRMVDLETGQFTSAVDPVEFDPSEAAKNPEMSRKIPPEEDIAELGRRANYARVYLVEDETGDLQAIVLPVRGKAYSEMSALLALAEDANTILGFKATEHEETPGLGGRVDDPSWRATWQGKALWNDLGELSFQVAPVPEGESARFRVPPLTGATITSRGVQNIIRFWAGEYGYGPLLEKIRRGELP